MTNTSRPPVFRTLLGATAIGLLAVSGQALAADPIKLGVIAEAQRSPARRSRRRPNWLPTKSTPRAASMAA